MQAVLTWAWRLTAGNPIFQRVIGQAGRRRRHLYIRVAYLLILLGATFVGSLAMQSVGQTSLRDHAIAATRTFETVATAQLLLVCVIAPIFAAGAITEQRDHETFNILLTTPLSAAQIVIGSLLSRLSFIYALLLGGLPIFGLTLLLGGVTLHQLFSVTLIAAMTATLFGSFAVSVALMGNGSRRSIMTFYVLIAVYLLLGDGLAGFTAEPLAPVTPDGRQMSFLTAFHPLLAQRTVLGHVELPGELDVQAYGGLWSFLLTQPVAGYSLFTGLLSMLLVGASLQFVRRRAWEGETTTLGRLALMLRLGRRTTRAARPVWDSPVSWREAKTSSSVGGTKTLRSLLVISGAVCTLGLALWSLAGGSTSPATVPQTARELLTVLVLIEISLVLLLSWSAAATCMSREFESKAIHVLISTPLTPGQIIGGKLHGLLMFALPLALVPVGTLAAFSVGGLFHARLAIVPPEAPLLICLTLFNFTAIAILVGIGVSLRNTNTVQAVIKTSVSMLVLHGLLFGCLNGALHSGMDLMSGLLALSPYTLVPAAVDPSILVPPGAGSGSLGTGAARGSLVVGCLLLSAAVSFSVIQVRHSLTGKFDTILRQKLSESG